MDTKAPLRNSHSQPLPLADPTRPAPTHQCRLCGRSYGRADHLSRHMKTHIHETARPSRSTSCAACFRRDDSLNHSHVGQLSHDCQGSSPSSTVTPVTRIERGERVTVACLACVKAKVKCQDQKPCIRCVRRRVPCQTPIHSRRAGVVNHYVPPNEGVPVPVSLSTAVAPNRDTSTEGQNQHQRVSFHDDEPPFLADVRGQGSRPDEVVLDPSLANPDQSSIMHDRTLSNSASYYDQAPVQPESFRNDNDISILDASPSYSFGFTPQQACFSQDVDFGLWDIDLDSVELAYPNLNDQILTRADPQRRPSVSGSPAKTVAKRYAAFERSPWLWKPTQEDRGLNDQIDLNLNEDSIPSVLTPESPVAVSTIAPSIGQEQRDQMLSLLLTLRQAPNQILHFPSLSLLNSIIEVFFVQESFRVDSFIHTGTFDIAKALPHLLVAIVSAGSMSISYPSIWKMGLALQEVVRNTLGTFVEQDNRHTRNLQALQGFMLTLDVGLWSGFKRKMELAESFGQPVIVMLRRADSNAVLESKWRKWAEQESFKRLVLHLFIHDTQASISFQNPPLISITEFKFSLPASRSLWEAPTAQAWARIYFLQSKKSASVQPCPDFLSALHNPSMILQHTLIDTHLTSLTLLYGYWTQIFSLLLSRKFHPLHRPTHQLILQTTQLEILSDLSSLSLLLPSLIPSSQLAETVLISHLLQMILYVSPEDLQRFAGKFGEEEAKLSHAEFEEWIKGGKAADARCAVWHAGQVLRAARGLGLAQCRGFVVVAIYYAALAVWGLGIVLSAASSPSSDKHGKVSLASPAREEEEGQRVVLNGLETQAAKIFRATGQGIPGLSVDFPNVGLEITGTNQDGRFISLVDSDAVLGVPRDIYRRNFQVAGDCGMNGFRGGEVVLPPLVENLGNLLRDLGSAPGSRVSRAASEVLASQ